MSPKNTAAAAAATKTHVLELEYDLHELPSSQHRAGLAGLVLMCRRWAGQPAAERAGVCELARVTSRAALVRVDADGLASVLDQVYAARLDERAYPKPFPNKEPARTEELSEVDARTGKSKTRTVYLYPVVVPHGGFVEDWDPTRDQAGIWIKLWRDMLWSIMRGVPATRAPFEARAQGKPDKLAAEIWNDLHRKKDTSLELPSTYFLGAQSKTAENVGFRDQARTQLLLHFWPLVAQLYVPAVLDKEGKRGFRPYAIAIPDVADLDRFCEHLPYTMQQRSTEVAGYVPRDAVVDLPVEGALELMTRLGAAVRERQDHYFDMVYGVDVVHVEKSGNNVRVLSTARVDIEVGVLSEYQRIRRVYRDHLFRRQRLSNLLARKPWHAGYERLLGTTPAGWTIESTWFRADVRKAFTGYEPPDHQQQEHQSTTMSDADTEQREPADTSLQTFIYRVVGTYIVYKLKSKHGLEWKNVENAGEVKLKDYRDKRQDIAKGAFLAVRSRTGVDFIDYFSGTLFSAPQKLGEVGYATVSQALLSNTDEVRTLTLLALSARA